MSRPLLDLHDLGLRQTGNELWARAMARALFEHDGPGSYDIAVTRSASHADLERLPARTVETVSTSSLRRLAFDLPRALHRQRSPVVLVQYSVPVSRVPAVVAVHDLSFEDPRARDWLSTKQRARFRATIRASVRRAAHLLAPSQATRDDLIRRYQVDPSRITVAHAGVDPSFADRLVGAPRSRRTGPATVLVVGNVVPRKNVTVVARAVRLLRDRGVDAQLRIVGRVPPAGRRDAADTIALLGEHVQFAGFLSDEDLATAYRSAAALAFPSWYEGFGIPLVEAMAAGTPVVAADRTSLPEVVGDAGLLVPADDPGAWADAIEATLDPVHADDLAARGRERSRTFAWATSAAAVSAVLADVAEGHGD